MRQLYRIIRSIVVSLLLLAVGIPTLLYLLLWLSPVHEKLRTIATNQLTELLGADVEIGRLKVFPLTRVELNDIAIINRGDTLLAAGALNAGVSGRNLLFNRRIVITDVELIGPDLRLRRDSAGAPLNIEPIIQRLKGDGSKPPKDFDLAIHTIAIRGGRGSYEVDAAPRKATGFDPNHISLTELNADITAPRIANGNFDIRLKRLAVEEASGAAIRRLAANIVVADSLLEIGGVELVLPTSNLRIAPTTLNLAAQRIGSIEITSPSTINPADAAPFVSQLGSVLAPMKIRGRAELFRDSISIESLELASADLRLKAIGNLGHTSVGIPLVDFGVNGRDLAGAINLFSTLKPAVASLIESLDTIRFNGSGSWKRSAIASVKGQLTSAAGHIDLDGELQNGTLRTTIIAPDLNLGLLLPQQQLGSANIAAEATLTKTTGRATANIESIEFRGQTLRNIAANGEFNNKSYEAEVSAADSAINATANMALDLTPGTMQASLNANIKHLDPQAFGLLPKFVGYIASARVSADFSGPDLFNPTGQLQIDSLCFINPTGNGLKNEQITLLTDFAPTKQSIQLTSGLADINATGNINLRSIAPDFKNILAATLPQYFHCEPTDTLNPNNFHLSATIHDDSPYLALLGSPLSLLYPAKLEANVNSYTRTLTARLSAPYIAKGNSLISHTLLEASLGQQSQVDLSTSMPSKFGQMNFDLSGKFADGSGPLNIALRGADPAEFDAKLCANLYPLSSGLDVKLDPGKLKLGGADWQIEPAYIGQREKSTIIHGFGLTCAGQELAINGVVSDKPDDRLTINLDNINVDYIFETLRLNPQIRFGGKATGTVTAAGMLTPEPVLQTDNLFVSTFNYGNCTLGDATIGSRWNNEKRAIEIHADVVNAQTKGQTIVNGRIMPLSSELDFVFEANHTPVGFIHTFTQAWASEVSGTASGRAHLFGDFKRVDLEGDMLAEDFGLTIGFTNVKYTANDSVHIRPGIVDLSGIRVTDPEGHSAILNGALHHRYFLDCDFNFRIDGMNNMLVLNTRPQTDEDFWYGTVRADGSVEIAGVPGHVGINANVSTSPGSEFTFVISDAASASEYTFLTFRDASPRPVSASAPLPGSPELDELMQSRLAKATQIADATNFNFDMQVDVTPGAQMTLVMDPDAGDKITGTGAGHIGLVYGSQTDEFRLYGDYRIEKGSYNFSLQDIILKTFQISPGSEIAFSGDPMNARLNISAIYQVNANLSDLDESFLNDKEVQRTNVPVYAVLNVDGQLQDPQISFDLDFPTLTSDVKRKVRSIVSTNEMMNRQIIYLLALNRFYTPDYMAATKGNDLMSVASGTLSSQLSNILGQLSDKISVAPSLRTDNGDFSDVEVDVALSSTLLNNRLLLNGNFGYRDKALNSNQFIGDFDAEYLLTRQGNWRVKAYNHFNDRNLYVKNALTTQGIGLVFKHDFDNLFKNIWKTRKKSVTLRSQ